MTKLMTILMLIVGLSVYANNGKSKTKPGHHGKDKGIKHQKHDDSKNHAHDFTKGKKHGHKGHDHSTADDGHSHKGPAKKDQDSKKACDCNDCTKTAKKTDLNKGKGKAHSGKSEPADHGNAAKIAHGTKGPKGKGPKGKGPKGKGPKGKGHAYGKHKVKGNNGLGNGVDPAPPGKAPVNDASGTPGQPANKK